MEIDQDYRALTVDTLSQRLGSVEAVASRVGGEPASWEIREVGDGNLNLVFIVSGSHGSVVVKQALPYVRMVGESWPLPIYRAHFECYALVRQAKRAPGIAPRSTTSISPKRLSSWSICTHTPSCAAS